MCGMKSRFVLTTGILVNSKSLSIGKDTQIYKFIHKEYVCTFPYLINIWYSEKKITKMSYLKLLQDAFRKIWCVILFTDRDDLLSLHVSRSLFECSDNRSDQKNERSLAVKKCYIMSTPLLIK